MIEYLLIILLGAIPNRGASWMLMQTNPSYLPIWACSSQGRNILKFSIFSIIILSFINGYLFDGVRGMLIIGILTQPATGLIVNMFLRFNPALQYIVFGPIYLLLTIYLIVF